MIPLRDDNRARRVPVVTWLLIAANVVVFIYQLLLTQNEASEFITRHGAIPYYISHGSHLDTIFSSMFLHGGVLHLAGNMLYLYVFGDNIESVLGHVRYLFFYLLCGVLAFASHYIFAVTSQVPMIGASGAISGVLGAYLIRFPHARVSVLVPLFIWIWRIFEIPAALVLGLWFVMQVINGALAPSSGGGVAWMAHVGGFIAGVMLMRARQRRMPRSRLWA